MGEYGEEIITLFGLGVLIGGTGVGFTLSFEGKPRWVRVSGWCLVAGSYFVGVGIWRCGLFGCPPLFESPLI